MAVSATTNAARRRFVYGVNAILQIILAGVLVVGVVWLAGRFKLQADTTRTGVNSLSPQTRQLLRNLDQNIRITAVFAEPDKRDALGQKRRRAIRDLLDLYDSAGGARVSTYLLDPSLQKMETDKVLKRLTELPAYKDEARPHAEALAKFTPLNESIRALAGGDFQRIEELLKDAPELARNRNLAIVRNNLRLVAREAEGIGEDLEDLKKGEIPRYGEAVRKVREYLNTVELMLRDASKWIEGDALALPGLTAELGTYFEQAPSRYQPVLVQITELLSATNDLKDVELEEVHRGLTRWQTYPPVLVESDREARVLSFWEVWPLITDPNAPLGPEGDDREFAGEAAISSAVLQLTQKEKTAVIFTRYGGESPITPPDFSRANLMMQQLPRAPYGMLNALLEKANFVTADWDLSLQKEPPEVEDAARRIYVVFPPEPPPRPNPMQPSPQPAMTPEDRQIVLDAVQASGMAVFLTGWVAPLSPLPGMTGTYEYADYLKTTWGVDVQASYLTLHFTPHPEKPGWWVPASREPSMLTTDEVLRFTDHPIAKPVKTDRAGLVLVAPLKIVPVDSADDSTAGAGVKAEAVAEVRPTEDVWAVQDLRRLDEEWKRNQGFRRRDTDLRPPFPVAVAATSNAGQKVVVFSSKPFASDRVAQATGFQQVGNSFVLGPIYPANNDLFINSLHWLTGEADRIAVGPRRGEVPRLKDLDDEWAARLPWFLVGIWPAAALLVGVGMWLVRRR